MLRTALRAEMTHSRDLDVSISSAAIAGEMLLMTLVYLAHRLDLLLPSCFDILLPRFEKLGHPAAWQITNISLLCTKCIGCRVNHDVVLVSRGEPFVLH